MISSENFNVIPTEKFKKQAKKLVRKYPPLIQELQKLSHILATSPSYGTSLGNYTFKIRIPLKSKRSGKRGGARMISYLFIQGKIVYLLTIYDKSEIESISDKQISNLIREITR